MLRGRYYGHYGQRRRRGGADVYTVMLLAQLLQRIGALEHKPPVTLAVMAGMPLRARNRACASRSYLLLDDSA